jgi:ribonucleoside-diphosphate reductase alpha chain
VTLTDDTFDVQTSSHGETDYHSLNAMLNLYDLDGKIQFDKDREAARQYHLTHVNPNTVFFHSLEEKLEFLFENEYYEREVFDQYDFETEVKPLYKHVYSFKFRFPTFLGAYKYYNGYTLKTFDGKRYLERFEDRVAATALYLARGNFFLAKKMATEIVQGRYQPATPTFLNAGKAQRGELVSCFLVRTEDNMESISRTVNAALQLSKRGGGVALLLSNLREAGAPIKKIEGQSSGVIPVMKLLEDSFKYSNQLGARDGAGAVYLNAHHPDIMAFLDTKRENADEAVRVKTLSLGVVIPDITFELARTNEDMYLFSPYDVERVYGKPFADISVTAEYRAMVDNPEIRKKKINARQFFQTLAELQFESGYPYILFEDTANRALAVEGRINMSNLCSEILQANTPSTFKENLNFDEVGKDISCNLGSMNIAKAMYGGNIGQTVSVAIQALTAVSDLSNIDSVPSIANGNDKSHAIGLGQMNLHGFLASEGMHYGSPESVEFVSAYFSTVAYWAINESVNIAEERDEVFEGFEKSKYASGEYFTKYIEKSYAPTIQSVKDIFTGYGVRIPGQEEWRELADRVQTWGMYNAYLQAIPPTGSISYINNATASIHPITAKIEIRKEGKIGRVYYPAFGMTNDNLEYYEDAYEIGYEKLIDVYAAATEHVDQGLSCTVFVKDTATTKDLNKAYIYAWRKGLKTLYYVRIRQNALSGTDMAECVSCAL